MWPEWMGLGAGGGVPQEQVGKGAKQDPDKIQQRQVQSPAPRTHQLLGTDQQGRSSAEEDWEELVYSQLSTILHVATNILSHINRRVATT